MVCSNPVDRGNEDEDVLYVLIENPRYAKIKIGDPPQEVEMDLNMLASDFYVVITTSRKGSKYDDLFSQSCSTPYLSSSGDQS